MKKILLTLTVALISLVASAQNTYYWVGGLSATTGINTAANWNTALNGSGTNRPMSVNAADILIIDGTNLGGATAVTGPATILATAGITAAQLRIINGAKITFPRPSSGTSAIILLGSVGEDFVVDTGCELNILGSAGSIRFEFNAPFDAARVSGKIAVVGNQQFRFQNLLSPIPGMFRFTSGSSFTTNITSTQTSYAFGTNSQSSSKWVVFEDGSDLYYEGGFSPNGSNSTFQPIDFKPNSTYHHRSTNALTGMGSFFNRKDYGNIIVENNSTAAFDGACFRINNFTINAGATATTHSSGITAIQGNLVVNGTLTADALSANKVNFCGSSTQNISGTGTINLPGIIVSESANVILNRDVPTFGDVDVFGHVNFTTNKITNANNFRARGIFAAQTGIGARVAGEYKIDNYVGTFSGVTGQTITGAGIPANTVVVGILSSSTNTDSTLFLSNPLTTSSAVGAFSISSAGATLQTANVNGFNPVTGSVANATNSSFENAISYTIDASTTTPFGFSTNSTSNRVQIKNIIANAPFTVNAGVDLSAALTLNAKVSLRPGDTLHMLPASVFNGAISASNYVAADYITATALQSFIKYDGVSTITTVPIGTPVHYLPVTLTPVNASDFLIAVFTGITTNGQVNGTQLLGSAKQLVVDAVWNLSRTSGNGDVTITLNWPQILEGTTFGTLPNSDIGLIKNTGTSYALPVGTGNNVANTVTGNDQTPGAFSAGAVPQLDPFIFNPILDRTYGAADFNPGALSQNTAQPIVYTSSNMNVATIVANQIHIVGAGTTTITASQASDGFYPAASKTQSFTVNRANLEIKADTLTRFEQLANPALTATYTGFVLGETVAALLTAPTISTTATMSSAPGVYPITVTGATSNNYNITQINATLTVIAKTAQTITFAAILPKTYGNAAFNLSATSTNTTIPITFTSVNTSVATIVGNTVTIRGAGTTTITANQAGSNGFFAATPQTQTLVVSKRNLTIRVLDTTKAVGAVNPNFTIISTGFVLGDTISNLLTPPIVTTIANSNSSPGVYAVVLGGATSNNYNIIYTDGKLTVLPATGTGTQYILAYRNAAGNIKVRVFSPFIALSDVVVYNSMGQVLARKNVLINKGFTETDVRTSQLASGIYIIKVFGSGIDLTTRISLLK